MGSFRGAGVAREPGIQEHCLEKSMAWRVSMGSGPGPKGHPGTTAEFFRTLLLSKGAEPVLEDFALYSRVVAIKFDRNQRIEPR